MISRLPPPPEQTRPVRIRVICVDDHRIVREGIALIIDREPDMTVVGTAASGEESVDLFRKERPDITLMDLRLRRMSGVEAIRAIRAIDREARVIVLTVSRGDEDIFRALEAGAVTYLLKDTPFEDLVRIVREVHAGQQPEISPDVKAQLAVRVGRPVLTAREVEVLELVRRGLRNREIAVSLGISEETVQTHVKNVLAKLEVQDRTAAIDVALQRGILHVR
jgi:DNA-binding NarL/FixJ family response regulator